MTATVTLETHQQQVLGTAANTMDSVFGDGVLTPSIPAYSGYKELKTEYKTLAKNAYRSLLTAFLKGLGAAPIYGLVSVFTNGFSAYGDSGFSSGVVRYHKDVLGYVHVEGLVATPGTPVSGTTAMFTLPTGFRPAADDARIFACVSNDLFASVSVDPNGVVAHRGTSIASSWVSLNLVFKAAQ